jgi:hypothetical protein
MVLVNALPSAFQVGVNDWCVAEVKRKGPGFNPREDERAVGFPQAGAAQINGARFQELRGFGVVGHFYGKNP